MKSTFHTGSRLTRLLCCIGAAAIALSPILMRSSRAWAYTTTGAYWSGSWPVVNYYINAASFPSSVGTQQQVIDAIRKGVNHWNFESGAKITFVYKGTTSIATLSNDGTNVIYYDSGRCKRSGGEF